MMHAQHKMKSGKMMSDKDMRGMMSGKKKRAGKARGKKR